MTREGQPAAREGQPAKPAATTPGGDLGGQAARITATLNRAERVINGVLAERDELVVAMYAAGWSHAAIAQALGITRQRAHQLSLVVERRRAR